MFKRNPAARRQESYTHLAVPRASRTRRRGCESAKTAARIFPGQLGDVRPVRARKRTKTDSAVLWSREKWCLSEVTEDDERSRSSKFPRTRHRCVCVLCSFWKPRASSLEIFSVRDFWRDERCRFGKHARNWHRWTASDGLHEKKKIIYNDTFFSSSSSSPDNSH